MANIKGKQLSSNLAVTNVTASGHISGSNTSTGSFAHVVVTSKVSGSSVSTGSFGRVEIGAGGIDTAGDITLDGDGGDIILKDGGVEYGRFTQLLGGLTIKSGPAGIAALVIASASASPTIIVGGEVQTTKNITGSSVTTGSFGNVNALRSITAADISASVIQASQGTIDIHSLSGYVANENIDHSSVTITAGSGLTGGGDITSTRTLAVGAGTGVTVNANDVAIGQAVAASSTPTFAGLTLTGNLISDSIISGSRVATLGAITGSTISASILIGTQITGSEISASVAQATQGTIDIHSLSGYVANENIDHTSVSVIAGTGLTGGGTIAANRTLNVIGGDGITANANDIAITAAQTTITSLLATDIKIGEDDQTKIDFETPNEIHFYADNTEQVYLGDNIFGPESDSDVDLGATGVRWKDAFVDSVTATGNVAAATITATGDITTEGDVIAKNYIVSSSVTHMTQSFLSGSTIFGDDTLDTHIFTGSLLITGSAPTDITTTNSIFVGNDITGSIISGSSLLGVVGTATQGTIDHDGLANFVANEHIDHSAVSVTAGDGLTGGGTIAANRTINVVGGDGITANANDVAVTAAQTAITSLINSSLTKIGTATDQEYIKFDTSNEVNVHINDSEKLSVTAAGANVTGDFAASATSSAAHILVTGIISGSQIEASGDVIAFSSSDRRFKDNLVVIEGSLDKIGKINGYEFDWNDKQTAYKGHDIGVVAQEIEAVLPEVVTTRGDGYKAVKYDKIVPLLIESIKELQKKVEDIEKNCDCLNK